MQEVTLIQMLEARERRVWAQQKLLARFDKPIVCFTMNIPGPLKNSPLIRRSFRWGLLELEEAIPTEKLLFLDSRSEVTGCEAMLCTDLEPRELKRLCVAIEDGSPLGRLFDMDVLIPGGEKLDREMVNGKSRNCIVCGSPGRGCASRRVHAVPELQAAANALMLDGIRRRECHRIGTLAGEALLQEVAATPKPGLVDQRNTGSHRDMDITTFARSEQAILPYFVRCTEIGMETASTAPEETFPFLRREGLQAEREMLEATNGVNTHKGAIFTMGLLCGAAGRLWNPMEDIEEAALFREISAMTRGAMEADFAHQTGSTAGEQLFASAGVRGIRGEAANGFPSIEHIGLPIFRELLAQGFDRNDAGVRTLLHLITKVEDTNMLHRGGIKLAEEAIQRTAALLETHPDNREIAALDDWFIENNLSPGGCADLLAAVYFVTALNA